MAQINFINDQRQRIVRIKEYLDIHDDD